MTLLLHTLPCCPRYRWGGYAQATGQTPCPTLGSSCTPCKGDFLPWSFLPWSFLPSLCWWVKYVNRGRNVIPGHPPDGRGAG